MLSVQSTRERKIVSELWGSEAPGRRNGGSRRKERGLRRAHLLAIKVAAADLRGKSSGATADSSGSEASFGLGSHFRGALSNGLRCKFAVRDN